jgi:hypothetical protein
LLIVFTILDPEPRPYDLEYLSSLRKFNIIKLKGRIVMPPKKTGEPKEAEGQYILKLGKSNNIIQWTDETKTSINLLYGVAGNFLTTNVRHEYPIPREEDYIPVLPAPEEGQPAIPPLPAALVAKTTRVRFRETQ